MITTVTLNPAIDKTINVEVLRPGGLNRVKATLASAGGKGINVSKALAVLGSKTLALGIVAGSSGTWIEDFLNSNNISHDFLKGVGETRTNLKVFDEELQEITELNEAGPTVSAELVEAIKAKVMEYAPASQFVVLSGSVPQGCPTDIYAQLLGGVQAKVVVDAEGELLQQALQAKPAIVKPNLHELEQHLGRQLTTEQEIVAAGKELLAQGVQIVLVSMGAEGSIMVTETGVYKALPVKVEVKSTVSAGDSMLAGLLHGLSQGLAAEEALRLAAACGTAAVMTAGTELFELEQVMRLREEVVVEVLSRSGL